MNNVSIIVGVALLLVFVVPVIWLNSKKNHEEKHDDTETKE